MLKKCKTPIKIMLILLLNPVTAWFTLINITLKANYIKIRCSYFEQKRFIDSKNKV